LIKENFSDEVTSFRSKFKERKVILGKENIMRISLIWERVYYNRSPEWLKFVNGGGGWQEIGWNGKQGAFLQGLEGIFPKMIMKPLRIWE
jgi:hypothetical protein